ncbi:MAG: hypothetical protein K0S44_2367 [Bacteroidetes bacterium]|jgi:hypothetical protein|nr:hypothetical protein [Bacteroidota bacterium]
MRKYLFVAGLIFTALTANSQSFKFGTIAADAGVGFGIYSIKAHSPVNGQDVSGIGFVGSLPTINAEFGIAKFLGVGFHYRRGTYGKSSGGKGRGNDLALRVNFHVANKNEKFDLPIGIGFGTTSFNFPLNNTDYFKGNGSLLNVYVAPHFYFGKYIGCFLSLGYNKHILTNIEARSGNNIYTEADDATWNMGGFCFEFGIAGRFGLFDKKGDNPAPSTP